MKKSKLLLLLSVSLLLPSAACGEDAIYKSVDEAGNVTYSSQPPAGAAKVEEVQVPAGPSEEAIQESLKRTKDMEKEADARYEAMMERRRQDAEAQKKKQEEAQAAEKQRQLEEAAKESASEPDYYYVWPDWRRPRPPYPPHPPVPPHPPGPPHPPLR